MNEIKLPKDLHQLAKGIELIFGIKYKEICEPNSREILVVDARRIFVYFACAIFRYNFVQVGKWINRTHATVIYHYKVHDGLYQHDKSYAAKTDAIRHYLKLPPIN